MATVPQRHLRIGTTKKPAITLCAFECTSDRKWCHLPYRCKSDSDRTHQAVLTQMSLNTAAMKSRYVPAGAHCAMKMCSGSLWGCCWCAEALRAWRLFVTVCSYTVGWDVHSANENELWWAVHPCSKWRQHRDRSPSTPAASGGNTGTEARSPLRKIWPHQTTDDHTRKTGKANLVTGYRVTLTEKDQVDKPLHRENTTKGNTTNT
jgi:hypothetical protein